jgi:hypothetical protein
MRHATTQHWQSAEPALNSNNPPMWPVVHFRAAETAESSPLATLNLAATATASVLWAVYEALRSPAGTAEVVADTQPENAEDCWPRHCVENSGSYTNR